MPELPEVETIARGLRDDLSGRLVTDACVNWPRTIHGMPPAAFADRIRGQCIDSVWRRAKYVVCDLSDDVLLIHLRMTGRLYITHPDQVHEADRWVRVTLALDDGRELRFSDSRKFGRMYLVRAADEVLGGLGPEPLDDSFTPDAFGQGLASRSGMIKPLLLNQSFLAGVGNIYADEALWQARIDPRRRADTLSVDEIERLYQAVRSVLRAGVEHEGASVSWYRKTDGTRGEQQNHFNAYDRAGEPCPRCGEPIVKIRLGQRGTHLCPRCQV